MSLTKEAILGAQDVDIEQVEVPEWGGAVHVRIMDGPSYDRYSTWAYEENKKAKDDPTRFAGLRVLIVSLCACDEQGNNLFSADDVDALARKSGVALDRVAAVALRINRLLKASVEEEVKNSEASPTDTSSAS